MKEEVVIKFAVYDSETSEQKRTTYRVIRRGWLYYIEVYRSKEHEWVNAFGQVSFVSIDAVLASARFQKIFKCKQNI